jgi:broad specificity phosphatase PhoE
VRILLIRHGQSVGNAAGRIQGWDDQPLTELGRLQSRYVAWRLRDAFDVQAIYASSLCRARETASILAQELGLAVESDDRLREHDCGDITGMSFEEISRRYPDLASSFRESAWRVPIPGEEAIDAFQQRVLSVMGEIAAGETDGTTVAVVAHGGVFSAYLAGLLELDFRRRQPWVFDNASLSLVLTGGVRPRIALLNDTSHLVEKQYVSP